MVTNYLSGFGRRTAMCASIVAATLGLTAGSASATPFNTCAGGVADSVFSGMAYKCESVTQTFDTTFSGNSNLYAFDGFDFTNTLRFDDVLHDELVVTMSAFWVTPGNTLFLDRVPAGYTPELFTTSTVPAWIYFRVEELTDGGGPPKEGLGNDYLGDWHQEIAWFSPSGTVHVKPEVFHDSRPLDVFGATPITDEGSFCPTCGPPGDPTIGGTARDFSDSFVGDVTVPEPASLLLVGSGLGALYRRRRQRALAARDSA